MPIAVAPPLEMTEQSRAALESMARSSVLPHRKVVQASALLLAADGVANEEIARRCHTTPDTVRRWRARFMEDGVDAVGVVAADVRGSRKGRGQGCARDPTRTPGRRFDAVVDAVARGAPGDRQGHRRQDLAGPQDLQRSRLRGEARRCRRALPGPAGTGGGVSSTRRRSAKHSTARNRRCP